MSDKSKNRSLTLSNDVDIEMNHGRGRAHTVSNTAKNAADFFSTQAEFLSGKIQKGDLVPIPMKWKEKVWNTITFILSFPLFCIASPMNVFRKFRLLNFLNTVFFKIIPNKWNTFRYGKEGGAIHQVHHSTVSFHFAEVIRCVREFAKEQNKDPEVYERYFLDDPWRLDRKMIEEDRLQSDIDTYEFEWRVGVRKTKNVFKKIYQYFKFYRGLGLRVNEQFFALVVPVLLISVVWWPRLCRNPDGSSQTIELTLIAASVWMVGVCVDRYLSLHFRQQYYRRLCALGIVVDFENVSLQRSSFGSFFLFGSYMFLVMVMVSYPFILLYLFGFVDFAMGQFFSVFIVMVALATMYYDNLNCESALETLNNIIEGIYDGKLENKGIIVRSFYEKIKEKKWAKAHFMKLDPKDDTIVRVDTSRYHPHEMRVLLRQYQEHSEGMYKEWSKRCLFIEEKSLLGYLCFCEILRLANPIGRYYQQNFKEVFARLQKNHDGMFHETKILVALQEFYTALALRPFKWGRLEKEVDLLSEAGDVWGITKNNWNAIGYNLSSYAQRQDLWLFFTFAENPFTRLGMKRIFSSNLECWKSHDRKRYVQRMTETEISGKGSGKRELSRIHRVTYSREHTAPELQMNSKSEGTSTDSGKSEEEKSVKFGLEQLILIMISAYLKVTNVIIPLGVALVLLAREGNCSTSCIMWYGSAACREMYCFNCTLYRWNGTTLSDNCTA